MPVSTSLGTLFLACLTTPWDLCSKHLTVQSRLTLSSQTSTALCRILDQDCSMKHVRKTCRIRGLATASIRSTRSRYRQTRYLAPMCWRFVTKRSVSFTLITITNCLFLESSENQDGAISDA